MLNSRTSGLMKKATYASFILAIFMVLIKLVVWLETDSVSLLSSFLDSLFDTVAALVNLLAVRQAFVPPDNEHRFGHGKIEPLASLGQSCFLIGTAVLLFIQSIQHLLHPIVISSANWGTLVMLVTIISTSILLFYQQYVVKNTKSVLISGDMIHYQSDLILSIGVIISLWLTTKIGWFFIDPLFGGAISVWIIYGAIKIAKKSITQLMDQELSNEDRKKIESIALNHPEVKAIHDLKTRSAGPNSFIQIHLEMDGEMMLNQAHEISKTVEREIMKSFPNSEIIIHQDPLN